MRILCPVIRSQESKGKQSFNTLHSVFQQGASSCTFTSSSYCSFFLLQNHCPFFVHLLSLKFGKFQFFWNAACDIRGKCHEVKVRGQLREPAELAGQDDSSCVGTVARRPAQYTFRGPNLFVCVCVSQAMVEQECVGAIVCKLDMHKKMFRRGYIAMLAVDSKHRRKSIGEILFHMSNAEQSKSVF